jgi:hypothetical protein
MSGSEETKGFTEVLEAERKRIKIRRHKAGLPEGDPAKDSVGLALSGGGIRSATFNLGLLQAMNYYNFFPKVDYLSTVSGGGYIGSSLTWFMSRLGQAFPFLTTCKDKEAARVLHWLRCHSSYLVPGKGLGLAALAAAVLRGMFVNLMIFMPLFIAVVYSLAAQSYPAVTWLKAWKRPDGFPLLFTAGSVLIVLLLGVFIVYALSSVNIRQQDFDKRRAAHVWLGRILILGVTLIALGLVPVVYDWLQNTFPVWWRQAVSSITLGGVVSLVAGWMGRTRGNETCGLVAVLLRIGLVLLLFGLLIWLYHLALYLHQQDKIRLFGNSIRPDWTVFCGILVSLFTGWMSNVNLVSMHRYYRDRLMEAYMPEFTGTGPEVSFTHADKCYLQDIPQTGAPYHIINTNMVTVGSDDPKSRARGGENFIFSPEFVGSEATGYVNSADFDFGRTNLATAFAISGAAVDPNTGATRSRPLAFLMTLLNVRLGYWLRNPARPACLKFSKPFWHMYMLREMFGWGMDEKSCYLHLSDGGHFENLGLYELVRRKCRYIIVADAGADPGWTFGDLARACERIRADFCAHLVINTKPLHPSPDNRLSSQPCTLGTIYYEDGGRSSVMFLKSTVFPNLPEDIYGYKRVHSSFPDQTTADQFFDEAQFEAYRELGYGTGRFVFEQKTLEEIFTDKEQ